MSISVDELVSSLSSSHIGQEAIDLATLQAQLNQAFFAQPIATSSHSNQPRDSFTQPCNTPTGRTPSSSFSWGQMMDSQRLSRRNTDEHEFMRDLDDMEDERMVEDLLIPSSPVCPSSMASLNQTTAKPQNKGSMSFSPSSPQLNAESSTFASTDPFYLAQLQSMQQNTPPPSVFSQLGRPAQQSPFMQQPQRRENIGFTSPSTTIAVDTHNLFMARSSAF
ncbi:hypothetical protein K435DRAFT_699432 [Dendrothele bispora CBS 962.96]|uniref:Uncharacterized protein n=1 Tax=Dendrothele bispora (strain CBS 962.96) TaxID=1314807 RepID=A0A4V4HBB3_DENBC|nr:hypothetical protein K435DRAFT_699432 [Dendrothele bispora CBS 962.96]